MGLYLRGTDPGLADVLLESPTPVDRGGHIPATVHPVPTLVVGGPRDDVLAQDVHTVSLRVSCEALTPCPHRAVPGTAVPHNRACRRRADEKRRHGQQ